MSKSVLRDSKNHFTDKMRNLFPSSSALYLLCFFRHKAWTNTGAIVLYYHHSWPTSLTLLGIHQILLKHVISFRIWTLLWMLFQDVSNPFNVPRCCLLHLFYFYTLRYNFSIFILQINTVQIKQILLGSADKRKEILVDRKYFSIIRWYTIYKLHHYI